MQFTAEQMAALKTVTGGKAPSADKGKGKAVATSSTPRQRKEKAPATAPVVAAAPPPPEVTRKRSSAAEPPKDKGKRPRLTSGGIGDFEDFCPGRKIRQYLHEERRTYLEGMEPEALEASMATSMAKLLLSSAYLLDYQERSKKEMAKTEDMLSDTAKLLKEAQLKISSQGAKIGKLEEEARAAKKAEEEREKAHAEEVAKLKTELAQSLEDEKAKAVEDYKTSVAFVFDMQAAILTTRSEIVDVCASTLKAQRMDEAAAVVEGIYSSNPEPSVATDLPSPTRGDDGAEVEQETVVEVLEEGEVPPPPQPLEKESEEPVTATDV